MTTHGASELTVTRQGIQFQKFCMVSFLVCLYYLSYLHIRFSHVSYNSLALDLSFEKTQNRNGLTSSICSSMLDSSFDSCCLVFWQHVTIPTLEKQSSNNNKIICSDVLRQTLRALWICWDKLLNALQLNTLFGLFLSIERHWWFFYIRNACLAKIKF